MLWTVLNLRLVYVRPVSVCRLTSRRLCSGSSILILRVVHWCYAGGTGCAD